MKRLKLALRNFKYYSSSDYWRNYFSKIFTTFLSFFGIVWLFFETANHFGVKWAMPSTNIKEYFVGLFAIFFFSVIITLPKLCHSCQVHDKDISVEIIVDNFFNQPGDLIIATNTTFDTTEDNGFIRPKSIQGQLAKKFYNKLDHLDHELGKYLEDEKTIEILNRTKSKNKRYPIGTVAKLEHENCRSYWLALADVNEYGKPTTSFEKLQESLGKLWQHIHMKGHLENLVIPVLGSGLSGLNETREKIVQEIIFSFVAFASEAKIAEKLTIAIHPDDFLSQKINFHELGEFLEYTCRFKPSANVGKSVAI